MITYKNIAEVVGVSRSTVANILNGTPHYKKETKEKVLRVAKEMGYELNRASRTIRRGRSNLIGVIHSGSVYEIGQRGVRELLREVSGNDFHYHAVDLHWHPEDSGQVISEMVQARVEGVILFADLRSVFDRDALDVLLRAGIPVVSLFGENDLAVPTVEDSADSSFYSLTRHLQGVGHRSLLLLIDPPPRIRFRSQQGRIRGFEAAIKEWGNCLVYDEKKFVQEWPRVFRDFQGKRIGIIVHFDRQTVGLDVTEKTFRLSRKILSSGSVPDAIMAVNDRAAYGAFSAAHELGIRVPEDLAITGADDDDLSRLSLFGLTTIRQDLPRSCRAAVEMLLAQIRHKEAEAGEVRERSFPSELVLRRSCGRKVSGSETVYVPTQPCPAMKNIDSAS